MASNDWKVLTSPYFPDTIHAKTQCEWEIKACCDFFHFYFFVFLNKLSFSVISQQQKAPGPYRVQIEFDVLQLLNHRTNGRCTTQSIDIIGKFKIKKVDV